MNQLEAASAGFHPPMTATELFAKTRTDTNPGWLTEYTRGQLLKERDMLASFLSSNRESVTVTRTTVGEFPAITVETPSLDRHTPLAQLLERHNSVPLAPRLSESGRVQFDSIPVPNFEPHAINGVQLKNSPPSQSHVFAISRAVRRAGFTEGECVSHYARTGEVRLSVSETPFPDVQTLGPNIAQPLTDESELAELAEQLSPNVTSLATNAEPFPPQMRFRTDSVRLISILQTLYSSPARIVEIRPSKRNRPSAHELDITVEVGKRFQAVGNPTRLRQGTDSTVVTITRSAKQAGLIDSDDPDKRLSAYARPGELRLAAASV